MPSRNINSFNVTDEQLREHYYKLIGPQREELTAIFEIAMNDKSLFPNINLSEGSTYMDFIERWQRQYVEADMSSPKRRIASPKSAASDPAVKTIVKIATRLTNAIADEQESHHNLFMSAENIQGSLLEEYIDSVISQHGWIWCKGSTLRAVDFCTKDGSYLLQVKNKSNSENSSSSNIRVGTSIKKWYRLGTRTKDGVKIPVYKWDDLNSIINSTSDIPCNMSETDYIAFVEQAASHNPAIITAD
jgi:hypothetical protein